MAQELAAFALDFTLLCLTLVSAGVLGFGVLWLHHRCRMRSGR